jgi:phosphoketolase
VQPIARPGDDTVLEAYVGIWLIAERAKEIYSSAGKSLSDEDAGNIDTPLELAIRNQTDRFSLAIDAIDRMSRFRVTGSGVREALLNEQIDPWRIAPFSSAASC